MGVGRGAGVAGEGTPAVATVRSALRMGAGEALVVYRRSQTEMTARVEEFHHATEEGVEFHWLTNPIRVLGDNEGWVTGLECQRMELGEADESGRARPVPIAGSEFVIEVDTVVLSIGNSPNPLLIQTAKGLESDRWGCLVADEEGGRTTRERVYAGGDAVTGAATVILAAGAGKRAAEAIHKDLSAGAA